MTNAGTNALLRGLAPRRRTPLIAGNWKMNLNHAHAQDHVHELDRLLRDAGHDYTAVEVAVLPPFTDLHSVHTLIEGDGLSLLYGAQDLSAHDFGAYTGDISGEFLATLGCRYVTVGHSERRQYHAETDQIISAKVRAADRHGLTPILCVGEGLEVRQEGRHVEYVIAQLDAALAPFNPAFPKVSEDSVESVVIAYEPVWAIGTGEVATPADAQEMCSAIRSHLAKLYTSNAQADIRILYGGSVKASSVAMLMDEPDVDGALVGGASIDPKEFAGLCANSARRTGPLSPPNQHRVGP